ncbi:uncharacterized protein STEHIDRAFT_69027 [Stereum hirsutum FP-91666 SS1]|uniref:Tc1-like transposase DDE domain-containing protein n=1 Tax=Stereum hirsutum (strain FP-91666) TaxID=721885 RepID=R7RZW3_STEHR|nr:uncharacterized protein STEHIDRAFT_69027 [Stereum hirsutum FP-91666 SS1]EIM79857.1 hypothetical protein STEHIDRAFT_69027 [Stereum hirsutum FP-91666 SS1]
MNVNPGGKQALLRDGWFVDAAGNRHPQQMSFPSDHPTNANQAKGLKQVLHERGLWTTNMRGRCKKCEHDTVNCCGKRVLELQPDFKAQKSLVQEVIEAAGHLCIFLPKYHCELNFIEYFWGAVKRHLRENSDYTFDTLKTNMPAALASVQLTTIRRWEHRMQRWMDAYRAGMETQKANLHVRNYSSRKYTSHRRIPEGVARHYDITDFRRGL